MEFTANHLANALGPDRHATRLVVAFSGGGDSTVLLHALGALAANDDRMHVVAVHIDHGLHPDSGDWSAHCERMAATANVAYSMHRVDVAPGDVGVEAAARDARYDRLRELIRYGDCLLTAHHEDDQFETVLLQLLRGAGPAGLAAMPSRARFGRGWHLRPLLDVSRNALRAYARTHRLDYLEDPANEDPRFDRAFLRRDIIPRIVERWPAAARAGARTAVHCAAAAGLLDRLGEHDLGGRTDFDLETFENAHRDRVANALRCWLRERGLPVPGTSHIHAILDEMIPAADDAMPCVTWPGAEVRRYRKRLYALTPPPPNGSGISVEATLDCPFVFDLPGPNGRLWFVPHAGRGLAVDTLRDESLNVRYRQGGERLRPAGSAHRRELKTLFQEQGIFPWVRERIPLVYVGKKLAAVADVWIDDAFAATTGAQALRLRWETTTRVC